MEKIKSYLVNELKPAITNIPWSEIPVSTYVSWIMAILLSVNTILMFFGLSPIDYNEDSLAKFVTLSVNVIVLIANTYKNNSTSKEAVLADKLMTALKLSDDGDKDDAINKINKLLSTLNENSPTEHTNEDEDIVFRLVKKDKD